MNSAKLRIAVVNDYEVVVAGVARFLAPFSDRIHVVGGIASGGSIPTAIDIALYDTFGRTGVDMAEVAALLARPEVERIAVYSFDVEDGAVRAAIAAGASGYLSKAMSAKGLTTGLLSLSTGEQVVAGPTGVGRSTREERGWPGQDLGLSEREAEVVALAAIGRRNSEIAEALRISIDTVKTHLARSFRKLEVHNRTELSALVHRRTTFRRSLAEADR